MLTLCSGKCVPGRLAPSPDPSLTITFYERTPEQQAALGYLADPSQLGEQSDEVSNEGINNVPHRLLKEPHGSVGARAGRQAIAQGNSEEMAEALFRYSAPEEVRCPAGVPYIYLSLLNFPSDSFLFSTGDGVSINLWSMHGEV